MISLSSLRSFRMRPRSWKRSSPVGRYEFSPRKRAISTSCSRVKWSSVTLSLNERITLSSSSVWSSRPPSRISIMKSRTASPTPSACGEKAVPPPALAETLAPSAASPEAAAAASAASAASCSRRFFFFASSFARASRVCSITCAISSRTCRNRAACQGGTIGRQGGSMQGAPLSTSPTNASFPGYSVRSANSQRGLCSP